MRKPPDFTMAFDILDVAGHRIYLAESIRPQSLRRASRLDG
jgi:hypothetical protein